MSSGPKPVAERTSDAFGRFVVVAETSFVPRFLVPSSGYHVGWDPLFNHGLAPLLALYFYGSAADEGAGHMIVFLVFGAGSEAKWRRGRVFAKPFVPLGP